MGRIEKDGQVKEELAQMKGEVVKEIRKTDQKRGKGMCSLFFFLVVIGLIGWMLWCVAATGLVSLSFLTSLAYRDPEPSRQVLPGVPVETVVRETAQSTLTRRLQQGAGVLTDASMQVGLDESSLTSTLQTTLEEMGAGVFHVSESQIVIRETGVMEVFLPLRDRAKQTALLADVRVSAVQGQLDVHVERMRLGSYKFPTMLTEFVAATFVKPQMTKMNAEMGQYASVQDIHYREGSVALTGRVEVNVVR